MQEGLQEAQTLASGLQQQELTPEHLLLALIRGLTAGVAVPRHRTLSAGWSQAAFRSLLRIDMVRALLATANAALALTMLALN